jgi:hypothetical protein
MIELARAHQRSRIASAVSDGNAAVLSSSALDDGIAVIRGHQRSSEDGIAVIRGHQRSSEDGIAGGVEGHLFVAGEMRSLQTAQPMLPPMLAPGTAPGTAPHRPSEMLHVTSDETLLPKCSHMLVYVLA